MARLLGTEKNGHITEKYWLHTGDDGSDRITVETSEDVEPIFRSVAQKAAERTHDFHYVASIPETVITEICKVNANRWGVRAGEVFRELMENKTDRAKGVWRILTQSREYSKLQARSYGS